MPARISIAARYSRPLCEARPLGTPSRSAASWIVISLAIISRSSLNEMRGIAPAYRYPSLTICSNLSLPRMRRNFSAHGLQGSLIFHQRVMNNRAHAWQGRSCRSPCSRWRFATACMSRSSSCVSVWTRIILYVLAMPRLYTLYTGQVNALSPTAHHTINSLRLT